MIRLNLLPDVRREALGTQPAQRKLIRIAQLASIVAIGVTLLLVIWVYGVQGIQKKLLNDSISGRYRELRTVKDIDTYATIQNQLASLTSLHDNKNLTSRLLDYLPSLNVGVTFNKVTMADKDHSLVFEGEAIDYRRLVIFRDTLKSASLLYKSTDNKQQKEPLFTSVTINKSSVRVAQDGISHISFKITGRYSEVAFKRAAVRPSLSIEKKETTPSVLAAPLVGGVVEEKEVRP